MKNARSRTTAVKSVPFTQEQFHRSFPIFGMFAEHFDLPLEFSDHKRRKNPALSERDAFSWPLK